MGVLGSFEPTKDCKAVTKVSPKDLGALHIDASATTFSVFRRLEGRLLLNELRKDAKADALSLTNFTTQQSPQYSSSGPYPTPPPQPQPPPPPPLMDAFPKLETARKVAWVLLAKVLNKIFSKNYDKSKDVIHFDGPPTTQKAYARVKRQKASSKGNKKLSELLAQTETRLNQMESMPNLSKRRVSRLQSYLGKTIFPLWIKTRAIDARATRAVMKELLENHGWRGHVCDGQFDICAGKLAQEDPNLVIVTTDSDLQFMGVHTLVRFRPQGFLFYQYPIKSIFQHCGLETIEEWKACAILSQNDYDSSIGRTSFKSAIKEIIKLRKSRKGQGIIDKTAEGYVKAYCDLKKVPFDSIRNSVDSFLKLRETTLESYQEGNDDLDESIRRIINRVEVLKNR